ncbi:hypothetical protein DERP_014622 [Dermatophagoides pteronyssinus]|uniref:Uncharacterized protein n=1 Tax=Dermatophagoides pteronyssinus TaxID=6956 RepID=A0ABQ8IW04_DERPT|nr:hypothetical protein DERP_014622 [Dermatophagoides pteronyssinus]
MIEPPQTISPSRVEIRKKTCHGNCPGDAGRPFTIRSMEKNLVRPQSATPIDIGSLEFVDGDSSSGISSSISCSIGNSVVVVDVVVVDRDFIKRFKRNGC